MRLKRLQVKGFKSFADKTEFEFDANLTGVVGPNGCGKSNVVDALKWVLGDQRAKSLRGAEMTDVIFKGAEGREGCFQAEVVIHLEDEYGAFGDRTEVSIGRRLNLEKESSYLLNGEVVRLKDVRDVLMNTGLGVGAYSVMEQGRIDAVLSANPESRRAIFEEAAGISKFKLQKRESLRKLDRTEANLARVKDLLEERARRIRSLKIQAGKARRFQEIRDNLRDLKTAVAVIEGREVRSLQHDELAQLATKETELAEMDRLYAEAASILTGLEERIADSESKLETVQDQFRQAQSRRDTLRARTTNLTQRVEELQSDAESCAERAAGMKQQYEDRQQAITEARERMVELEEQAIELHRDLEQRRALAAEGLARVKSLQTDREASREAMLEWIHERTRNRNLAHDQEAQIRSLHARGERIESRVGGLRTESLQREAECKRSGLVLEDLHERGAHLDYAEQGVLSELDNADVESAELSRLEGGLRERFASVSSRLEILQGMEAHHEGVDQGPKYLLDTQPLGLRGRLVDLIDTDVLESKALEAALGGFVQAMIVDTRENADAMLQELADEDRGRAILLVAEEFEETCRVPVRDLPYGAEILADRVHCADDCRPMVHWLLRGVCVVESLEDSLAYRTDLSFVTRTGELLCGPRVEGGQVSAHVGLVERKAQILSLSDEVGELDSQLAGLQGDMVSVADRVSALKDRVRRLGTARQGVRELVQRSLTEQSRASARLDDLKRELATIELEAQEIDHLGLTARAKLSTHLLNEHLIRRMESREKERESEITMRLEEARMASEEAVTIEQDIRVQQAACTTERDAFVHKIEVQEQTLHELDQAVRELDERRLEATEGIERAEADRADCAEEATLVEEELLTYEEQREIASDRLQEERRLKTDAQETLHGSDKGRSDLREATNELRLSTARNEHQFARLEERLRDETGIELLRSLGEVHGLGLEARDIFGPPSSICADLGAETLVLQGPPVPEFMLEPERRLNPLWDDEDFDLDAVRKEAQVLQSQSDRLGAVNLDAVKELEEEETKFGTLEGDVEDLSESRKALMEALRTMEVESRMLFDRTFEQARENFRDIFRKLFQGGRADMYLTESEDTLESGIEIMAKPPGKELQSIALLSGGERSLTALAILFAVFKVKPSPFCILDEVDAALDETNVERFIRVLDDFVGPTQFCIVTHHKRTMAACQVLYGITMQRRGVSTRIAVSLDEVDEFGEEHINKQASKQRIAGEESVGF